MIVAGFKYLLKLRANDVIYDPLPLYHTAGGLLGTLPALVYGLSVVIKVKFSASSYFADCVKYKCTVSTYSRVEHVQSGVAWAVGDVLAIRTFSYLRIIHPSNVKLCGQLLNYTLSFAAGGIYKNR